MNRVSLLFLLREARSAELRLLVLALVLAVAAVTGVGFFSDRINRALVAEGNQLLGADLVVASDHPLGREMVEQAGAQGLQHAETVSFPSMVMTAAGEFQLADLKAVSGAYPLRGVLRVSNQAEGVGDASRGPPPIGQVWIEPRLGAELGVRPGDRLQVGERDFLVAAYLLLEPDRGLNLMGLAPRLMLNLDDLESTGLIQNGARVTYRVLLAGEPGVVASFSEWISPRLARGERVEEGQRPGIRAAFERGERFFGLATLLTVILSATVMALTVRRYIGRQLDTCALLRCLGASRGKVFSLYLIQFLLMGLVATLLGLILGFVAHFGLYQLLAGLMGVSLPAPGLRPVFQGGVLGMVLLLSFSLPPLLRLHQVSPLRVLRRDLGLPSPSLLAAYGLGLVALIGIVFWIADDPKLGGATTLAFVIALVVFGLFARGMVWLVSRLRWLGRDGGGFGWRYGLANLNRHAWSVSMQVVALSLGFMALLLLTVIRSQLMSAWEHSIPEDAPNRFVINIQPEQKAEFARRLTEAGWKAEIAPMVRGRLVSIGGRPVSAAVYPEDERAQRLVEREFNLSWRADLPRGNQIEAGQWFADGQLAEASVESGMAKTLGIGLGDQLVFNIAGESVSARVTSLRKLDWDSMRINFFVLMSPGIIDHMPMSYLGNFYLPSAEIHKLGGVLTDFPNVTVIDLSVILAQLKEAVVRVSEAVQFVFLFALGAGILVLQGALASAFGERHQTLAIMRALGASRSQLRASLTGELVAIGGLAGLLSAVGAVLAGKVLAWRLFDLSLVVPYWLVPVAVVGGGVLTIVVAYPGLNRLLSGRPLDALRSI